MSLNIRIRHAELTRNTEIFGNMFPFVLVRDPTGAEIKRTIVGKGKHPTFEDSFMVPLTTQALEFVILDKEGGIFKKNDDVVGGGWWRCAEIAKTLKQPFETFVPVFHEGRDAGRVIIEVYLAGVNGQQPMSMQPGVTPSYGTGYPVQQPLVSPYQQQSGMYSVPPGGYYPPNGVRF